MIPLILSVDTLSGKEKYGQIHHKTRVDMLNTSLKLVRDIAIIFVIKIPLDVITDNLIYLTLRLFELIFIILLCRKLVKLFRYLLDEITRFENFNNHNTN